MSVATLDPVSQVLQFKACLAKLVSVLLKIPLPLLDRWVPSLPDSLFIIECRAVKKAKALNKVPATKSEVNLNYMSISGYTLSSNS